jgi:hypothetical protein
MKARSQACRFAVRSSSGSPLRRFSDDLHLRACLLADEPVFLEVQAGPEGPSSRRRRWRSLAVPTPFGWPFEDFVLDAKAWPDSAVPARASLRRRSNRRSSRRRRLRRTSTGRLPMESAPAARGWGCVRGRQPIRQFGDGRAGAGNRRFSGAPGGSPSAPSRRDFRAAGPRVRHRGSRLPPGSEESSQRAYRRAGLGRHAVRVRRLRPGAPALRPLRQRERDAAALPADARAAGAVDPEHVEPCLLAERTAGRTVAVAGLAGAARSARRFEVGTRRAARADALRRPADHATDFAATWDGRTDGVWSCRTGRTSLSSRRRRLRRGRSLDPVGDTVPPEVEITQPPAGSGWRASVDVLGRATDPHLAKWTLDLNCGGSQDWTALATRTYRSVPARSRSWDTSRAPPRVPAASRPNPREPVAGVRDRHGGRGEPSNACRRPGLLSNSDGRRGRHPRVCAPAGGSVGRCGPRGSWCRNFENGALRGRVRGAASGTASTTPAGRRRKIPSCGRAETEVARSMRKTVTSTSTGRHNSPVSRPTRTLHGSDVTIRGW